MTEIEAAADKDKTNGRWDTILANLAPADADLPHVPQQARSREKRDRLLEAAAHLFIERGYEETTSDEIAISAGVSVGSFYKYFRNKRQVLLTLIASQFEEIFSHLRISEIDLTHDNHRQVIRQSIEEAMRISTAQRALRRAWQELLPRDPELANFQRQFRRRVLDELVESLGRASSQSRTWSSLDHEATAVLILSLVETMTLSRYDLGQERMIESITDMIDRAIFPPS